jgi:hypothetical protein
MALLPDFVEYYHMHVVVCGEECKKYKRALKKINMLVYMQVMSDEEIDGRDTYYELGEKVSNAFLEALEIVSSNVNGTDEKLIKRSNMLKDMYEKHKHAQILPADRVEEHEDSEEEEDSEDDEWPDDFVWGIVCTKCNCELEPHSQEEHLDINHCVHKCESGHRRR